METETPKSRNLRLRGLAFFGAVSASLSHEINNVLAIVGELSGLLGDLSHGAVAGNPPDSERLKSLSTRMADQVARGKRLVKRLNRFAHTVDQPVAAVSVTETLELIAIICRRFADLKSSHLKTQLPHDDLVIESSAFGLMRAAHLCIITALGTGEQENRVTVGYEAVENGCHLIVTSRLPITWGPDQAELANDLDLLLEDLHGRVVKSPVADHHGFVLFFPRRGDNGPVI